jgi:release factor glutamine methyltransferase
MLAEELLKYGENRLRENAADSFHIDAKLLLWHVLGVGVSDLAVFYRKREVALNEEEQFKVLLNRRILREPIAKIINKKYFWKSEFFVDGNVLDPRPDTETLVEAVIRDFKDKERLRILDLGTGSGCLIISLLNELKNASGVAVDLSQKALDAAKFNAEKLGVSDKVTFLQNNWNDNIMEKFDVIVSNPPYIESKAIDKLDDDVRKYEPRGALDGGADGLFCYRYLAKNIGKNCVGGTRIYLEVGCGQANIVKKIFEDCAFSFVGFEKDLNRINRVVVLNF